MAEIPTFQEKLINDFWRGANGVTPRTPYEAEVELESGDVFQGIAMFSMPDRRMIAEFSPDTDDPFMPHKFYFDGKTRMRISQMGFEASVSAFRKATTWSRNRSSAPQVDFIVDKVDAPWTADELSHFVVGASGIADFSYDHAVFVHGTIDGANLSDATPIDEAGLDGMVIPRMTVETDEWWVRVSKLAPTQLSAECDDTHSIVMQKKNGGADRLEYEQFFKQLFPLLKFIFGSTPELSIGVGYASDGGATWGQVYNSKPLAGGQNSWFAQLGFAQREFNLDKLLDNYLRLIQIESNNETVFRKLFHHYAVSEHFQSLGLAEMSFNTSFAALEGMCKFILSTPRFKNVQSQFITFDGGDTIGRFKKRNQQTEKGMRHVVDAIVSAITNGESDQLTIPEKNKQPHVVDVLIKRRNETVHLELDEKASATPIRDYQLWNASQFVFELLALSVLMSGDSFQWADRTNPGEYKVMGKDMYAHLRSGQVKFSSKSAKKT